MSLSSLKKAAKQVMNFYRRPLPSFCISFSSEEGKIIFKEAMTNGQMENYFRLASQFRTQDEPAFCGLATLVMVLNALEIDPGRIWKGPWRWYHEDMLDCCIPLDTVKSKGITLDQFICISKCNGLTANARKMFPSEKFDDFKEVLTRITKSDEEILVVSYSRKGLGQTGSGHFASVGGYHRGREMVLLFDTARFKYPPHWVPLDTLWVAMKELDEETGQPRGYITLTKDTDSSCLLLLATSEALNEFMMTKAGQTGPFTGVMHTWNNWLKQKSTIPEARLDIVRVAAIFFLEEILFGLKSGHQLPFPLTCHSNFSYVVTDELEFAMCAIIRDIAQCSIGTEISGIISSLDPSDVKLLSERVFILPKLHGCSLLILQDDRMKITFLLATWLMTTAPIKNAVNMLADNPTNAAMVQKLATKVVFSEMSLQSQMELVQLSNKINKMYSCHDKVWCCAETVCGAVCH